MREFARARLTGVKTDAFANDINSDGSTGYYSMFFVKASSAYKSIDQLKGKNLGLVDPNSTSGNNVPRFELDKLGISDADTYFATRARDSQLGAWASDQSRPNSISSDARRRGSAS